MPYYVIQQGPYLVRDKVTGAYIKQHSGLISMLEKEATNALRDGRLRCALPHEIPDPAQTELDPTTPTVDLNNSTYMQVKQISGLQVSEGSIDTSVPAAISSAEFLSEPPKDEVELTQNDLETLEEEPEGELERKAVIQLNSAPEDVLEQYFTDSIARKLLRSRPFQSLDEVPRKAGLTKTQIELFLEKREGVEL